MKGSPPHVRGKDALTEVAAVVAGITPACAGKSLIPPLLGFGFTGSPPHVRGKDKQKNGFRYYNGITPACAGKRPSGAVVIGVV